MRELIHPSQLAGYFGVVVGAGASGVAAAKLLGALGARVRIVDRKGLSKEALAVSEAIGAEVLVGEHTKDQFKGADMVVVSPGIPVRKMADVLSVVEPRKVIAELELAAWFTSDPIIAVTGTSGKTTTTSMIAQILEKAGKKVFLGGNIGTPLSEYLLDGDKADVLVLEVSSFQLQNCRSFKPHVGVWLNFAPNHLDYHEDMDEYFAAKAEMFRGQGERDLAIFPLEMRDIVEEKQLTKARKVYFVPAGRFENDFLIGEHNQSNMEAAWHAARAFGVTEETAREALAEYRPHPHRLEKVLERDGVVFVDDSKATTIDALKAALKSFDKPIRLLVGGVFKGGELSEIADLVKERVVHIYGFGQGEEHFGHAFAQLVEFDWFKTLEEAVEKASADAQDGDVVLLSPATSSFDLFANYKERGLAFRAAARGGK